MSPAANTHRGRRAGQGAFLSVHVEGGLFSLDFLERLPEAEGQKPKDFGITGNRSVADEASNIWTDVKVYWEAFKRRLERAAGGESLTTITREQWIIPLLEALGYRPRYQKRAQQIAGRAFPISHRADEWEDAPPVHIVACDQNLGARPTRGSKTMSPHTLLQEYLNETEHLWGIVTNGETLRLLRDSAYLTRQAYVEFDLKGMLEGDRFSEFIIFYRLVHRTRLPEGMEDATRCLLEKYHAQAREQGGRIREGLRDAVEETLKILANGFLHHPDNTELREACLNETLTPIEFYQELLRLIYRLLFLMVAEERGLLTDNPAYHQAYGVTRLRKLAEVPLTAREKYHDLYYGLVTLFHILRNKKYAALLDLEPLNGELFEPLKHLENAKLTNAQLLEAVHHLSYFTPKEEKVRRWINYTALDVEELGSIYESLLELQPVILREGDKPVFTFAQSTERKSTGSYYTPQDLVQELVKSALDPVIEQKIRQAETHEEKETALLSMKVCDPASGSGHFLLAAARRLAKELARVRTETEEPPPEDVREAMREVIRTCIYGVDKNPLAVDLCKVALWIEGHSKGKPLTFLDHHIKCGDSLVGVFDLKVLLKGIPDDAYKPVGGDDKQVARRLKDENKRARKGARLLSTPLGEKIDLKSIAKNFAAFATLEERQADDVRTKAKLYHQIHGPGTVWERLWEACNLWTAAFFLPMTPENEPVIPTTATVKSYLENPKTIHPRVEPKARELARKYRFFHWPLEFPEVFVQGGFDVVLGNPPFLGGLKISGTFGNHYRKWLRFAFHPFKGTVDLCSAFYRRGFDLLGSGGRIGMVATNTIGQGDTRESGLAVILKQGGTITFVRRFVKWPGAANVEVNLIAIYKPGGQAISTTRNSNVAELTQVYVTSTSTLLDGHSVKFISSRLDDGPEANPQRLPQNKNKAFQGDIVRGLGFVLVPEEAERLITKNQKNTDCLFPYLNGEDLNSHPEQKPRRWVICFHDWDLVRVRQYPDLLHIVEEKVRSERDNLRGPGDKRNREYWWQFGAYRVNMRIAIAPLRRILVRATVSDTHAMTFVPNGWVYGHKVIVFAFEDDYHFALLQSSLHELWMRRFTSTMRTDVNYSPSDCFSTFPFPLGEYRRMQNGEWQMENLPKPFIEVALLGDDYNKHRRQIMLARQIGLTKTYNLFHNPNCQDKDIVRLRDLHAAIDRAILACYEWNDINPVHGFYPNERGQVRYTVSPEKRREILQRLLGLNLKFASNNILRSTK